MKKVIYIHGGESFEYDKDFLEYLQKYDLNISDISPKKAKWNRHLDTSLGGLFDVISPQMPNARNAKFIEWKIWFEKVIDQINDEVILVGNSLGSTFLLQYLSENILPNKIEGLFLVAPAREAGDMSINEKISQISSQVQNIFLYHSRDDEVVAYSDSEWIHKKIPSSTLRSFSDFGHFKVSEIPKLYADIRFISKTQWIDFSNQKKTFILPVTGVITDIFFEKITHSSSILKSILEREGVYKSQSYLAEHYLHTAGESSKNQFHHAFKKFGFDTETIHILTEEAELEYRKAVLSLKPSLQHGIKKFIKDLQSQGHKIIILSISSSTEIAYIQKQLKDLKEIIFVSKDGVLDQESTVFHSTKDQIDYLKQHYIDKGNLLISFATTPLDIQKSNEMNLVSIAVPYLTDKEILLAAKPSFLMDKIQDVL